MKHHRNFTLRKHVQCFEFSLTGMDDQGKLPFFCMDKEFAEYLKLSLLLARITDVVKIRPPFPQCNNVTFEPDTEIE